MARAEPATSSPSLITPVQGLLVKIHRGALGIWTTYVGLESGADARMRRCAPRPSGSAGAGAPGARRPSRRTPDCGACSTLRERLPLSALAGEVVGRESGGWVRAITVNRGRGSGVAQQTPVIVPEGLVGRVVQVRPGASVVQLINDPASTVGAVVQRTRTPGLVEGDAGGVVRFKFMARDGAQVAPGDLIVTSGLGSLFPKGLPVGRVVVIEDKGSALFHFAVVAPAADFPRVEEVLLLTGQTTQDIAALFRVDG